MNTASNNADYQLSPDLTGWPLALTPFLCGTAEIVFIPLRASSISRLLTVEAGPDQTVDLGFTANINAVISPPFRPVDTLTPSETLDCNDCEDPTALPLGTTVYNILIVDSTGCIAFDSLTIFVDLKRPFTSPTPSPPTAMGSMIFHGVYWSSWPYHQTPPCI
ncbi:MAG: hypothetical protein R2825_01510 [Saprospiraceae bacterium]